MSDVQVCDSMSWYAIRTHPRQEDRASENLSAQGFETVSPKIKQCRYNQFSGAPTYTTTPLFPRYIFAHFQASAALAKIRFTRGVQNVVGYGNQPASLDEELITIIKSRMREDGLVKIGEEFNPGDEVRIKNGPFKDFIGIFERSMGSSNRVMIMLNTINFQGRVCIEGTRITKHA